MGSTYRANFKASELTISTLAGDTAKIMLLGFAMYSDMSVLVCFSISVGWSPMGTFVKPGKSTSVRLRT